MSAFQTKILFLILTILISLTLLIPLLNYIPILSTGDHGRDFYCAQQVLEGKVPYHDFWWVYGPLMPYYYAMFYKLFGIQMSSILIGKMFIVIICEIFFYLILANFTPSIFALIGTLWFLLYNKDFFFTFNHIGGVACLLGSLYFVFNYFKNDKTKYLYLSLCCLFILALIKINFALSSLGAFIISVRLIESFKKYPKKALGPPIALLLGLICIIYFLLLYKLPVYEIRQCFPYLSSDQPQQSTPLESIRYAVTKVFGDAISNLPNLAFTILIFISSIAAFIKYISRKTPVNTRNLLLITFFILITYYLFNIHEYILSGTVYRAFWVKPVSILLVFFIIFWATKDLKPILLFLLYSTLLLNIFLEITNANIVLKQIKRNENFLNLPKAQIYLSNQRSWIDTVEQTTRYLRINLAPNETFFALPYDCLYYFLTEKQNPTRQLIFFDHINIPQEQELKIIEELEKNKVNWVVVSSRSISIEDGLGTLGVTYCPLIGKYIADHFKVFTQFGDWSDHSGWGWNHGTRIMKRINPI